MKVVSVVHRVGVVALAVFLSWSTAFGQTVLTCGSIVNGSVGGDGQVVYFFDAEAGDDVIIYLLCTDTGTYGAFRPCIEVYPPSDGAKPIASVKADYVGSIRTNPLPETGRYTIIVRDCGSRYSGKYQMSIYWWAPVEKRIWRSTMFCGESFADSLGWLEAEFHRFWGRKDSVVRLSAQTTDTGTYGAFLARCMVYAPDLYTKIFDGTANYSFSQIITLPEEGEYTIFCVASNMRYGGSYRMTLDYQDPPCAATAWFKKWVPPAEQWDNTEVNIAGRNVLPMTGIQLGFWFDERVVVPVDVLPGASLPAGTQLFFDLDASLATCANPPIDPAIHRAVTIGAIFSSDGSTVLNPGTYDLFTVKFERVSTALPRDSTHLVFADCVGDNVYPPQSANVITNASGLTYPINQFFMTEIGIPEDDPFRRGDANGDRRWDISDVIIILRCLFKSELCSTCPDVMDANDDGKVDISDVIYLIDWRFNDKSPPPAPFPACGQDTTADDDPLSKARCSYTYANC